MIRLGKLALYHCRECNIPLLKRGHDGVKAEHLSITPPGDIRPAFEFDRKMLREVIEREFGSSYVPEVTIFNSIPAIDRSDEVIIDGRVAGIFYYDIFRHSFYFQPRPWYASLLDIKKGYVVADDGAVNSILKTSNLMGPGVIEYDGEIREGDEVVILNKDGSIIATGKSRRNAENMKERGMAVKVRWRGIERAEKGRKITWRDVIKANEDVILNYEKNSQKFIDEVLLAYKKAKAVSFSGGKDSLATLLLLLDAGYEFPMMFINTGIEFNETVNHVYEISSRYGVELIEENAGNAFWEGIKIFGPPARDFRWCCKTCKLGPIVRLIKKHFNGSVVSFIGQRRYESENRAKHGNIWQNPWVKGQISVSPIQNWTALHVWLYLFIKKAKWNKLYENGFYRIGCWLCPSSNMADFEIKKHEEWSNFEEELKKFASRHHLPAEWMEYGLWRWRKKPGWSNIEYKIEKKREYRLEGNKERILNFLNIIGKVEEHGNKYFAGKIRIEINDDIKADKEHDLVKDVIYRSVNCLGCGVCLTHCPRDAIYLKEGRAWIDERKCIHCKECMKDCPLVVFG